MAGQVLARLPAGEGWLRFNAEWNLARAHWLNVELGEAEHALAATRPGSEVLAVTMCWQRGEVLRAQGRLGTALAGYRQALAAGTEVEGPAPPGAGVHARGCGRSTV